MKRKLQGAVLLVALALLSSLGVLGVAPRAALAKFARVETENVPIGRLLEKLEGELKVNPKNKRALLAAARLQAMAYATKADTASVRSGSTDVWEGYAPKRIPWTVAAPKDATAKDAALAHLKEAIRLYRLLLEEDPKSDLGRLGLAWCLLESGEKDEARTNLRKLVADAWPADEKAEHRLRGDSSLTEEAGHYLKDLLDPTKDKDEIAELDARFAKLDKIPRFVTPILVPLDADAKLDDLLAPRAAVSFDVDGRARKGTWSWITPRAGWLVQLPRDGRREVTSGLQLFGTVTWWLFWEHGYEPLAALDDDGDGVLRGDELRGLAIWQDRNGDGRCDEGEVKTLAEWGVESLATASEESDRAEVARWSPRGVVFKGGAVRATWDVILAYTPRRP